MQKGVGTGGGLEKDREKTRNREEENEEGVKEEGDRKRGV